MPKPSFHQFLYQPGQLSLDEEQKLSQRQEKLAQTVRAEEEAAARARAMQLGLPYANLDVTPINLEALGMVSEKAAQEGKLAVIQKVGHKLQVALYEPSLPATQEILQALQEAEYEVALFIVSESSLRKAWELYKHYRPAKPSLEKIFLIEEEHWLKLQRQAASIQKLKAALEHFDKHGDTNDLLALLFVGARVGRATDIHFEPQEESLRVRFRIDGVLQDIVFLPKSRHHPIVARLKILAELKLNLHNIHQDGRFTLRYADLPKDQADIDIRVSILPSSQGETVVLRLLGVGLKKADLTNLGMLETQLKQLRAQMSKPNGMILTTGPTGSGKTTTLYSILRALQNPKLNIVTIEDPIEYRLEGIKQTQVDRKKGYTFEKGLEAIVRQDPDIILVGEIRSAESADLAINAALTGHLVLSTLHTNDAAGTIARLQNLGVDRTLLPSALNLAMAQRLVRKLCPHCKKQVLPSPEITEAIEQALSLISPKAGISPPEVRKIYRPGSCEKCFGTGYYGRIGIFELFDINDAIEQQILQGATSYQIRKVAMEQGMITLLQHGLLKLLEGVTSLEEIQRVAGDARYIETLYGQAVASLLSRHLEVTAQMEKEIEATGLSPAGFEKLLKAKPLEQFLALTMGTAFLVRATDVHLEPAEQTLEIRFRIDGVLHKFAELSKRYFPSAIAQVKKLAGLKVGTYSEVQEGRFSVIIQETAFDVRVSVIPGGYGETVALRLLDPHLGKLTLENLGLEEKDIRRLLIETKKSQGMILATGPTGHGKTTTLYALMARLDRKTQKIITIENPIEYRLEGLIQTQIDPEHNYTYEVALKSLLRQDPDVLMIGEIRDFDTAQAAIRASMTGHLIFSTLHTNDAPSAVDRLHNLGLAYADISAGLNVVIAERLLRRLCQKCKKPTRLSSSKTARIKTMLQGIKNITSKEIRVFQAQGCQECSWTGYKGRIGIFEIMYVDENLKNLIAQGASYAEIKKAAQKNGMRTLRQDGLVKVLQGITSLEEWERILGDL